MTITYSTNASGPSVKPIFSQAELGVLIKAAYDIAAALEGTDKRVPALAVGDSPSWTYRMYVALGLSKNRHPMVPLLISGRCYKTNVYPDLEMDVTPSRLYAYYSRVVWPIFKYHLPPAIPVIDYTGSERRDSRWTSLDGLQGLFREIWKTCYKPKSNCTCPNLSLIRLLDEQYRGQAIGRPHSVSTKAHIYFTNPGGSQPTFLYRMTTNAGFPRGVPKFTKEQWESTDTSSLWNQFTADPRYRQAVAEIQRAAQAYLRTQSIPQTVPSSPATAATRSKFVVAQGQSQPLSQAAAQAAARQAQQVMQVKAQREAEARAQQAAQSRPRQAFLPKAHQSAQLQPWQAQQAAQQQAQRTAQPQAQQVALARLRQLAIVSRGSSTARGRSPVSSRESSPARSETSSSEASPVRAPSYQQAPSLPAPEQRGWVRRGKNRKLGGKKRGWPVWD